MKEVSGNTVNCSVHWASKNGIKHQNVKVYRLSNSVCVCVLGVKLAINYDYWYGYGDYRILIVYKKYVQVCTLEALFTPNNADEECWRNPHKHIKDIYYVHYNHFQFEKLSHNTNHSICSENHQHVIFHFYNLMLDVFPQIPIISQSCRCRYECL